MSDLSLAIKLSTEGGQVVVKELTQIGQAAGVTNRDLESTGPAGDAASKGLAVTAASAATLNSHLMMLMRTVGLVAGGLGAFALIDRSDEWGQYASRIRHATKSVEEYDYVQQRMVSSANDTFRAITETKESFIQMSPILRDMGYQLTQSIDIVDSFSSLLVVNAARADRAAAAQSALAGSIQRGGVDADSWKTIFGTMPTILDNLTAATGKTASEIRELGITGKLSITDLTNALLLSYEENRKAVEAMPTTVRDAIQSFNTVFTEYIGWQNEAKGITAEMANGIVFLADHFDTLVNIVGGVAVAALTNYTVKMGAASIATIQKMNASMAALAIDAQAAIGAERAAIAEKNAAFASLERARAAVAKAEAEVVASQRIQAAELSRLKAVQAALLGESALEAQRHRAQISDIGRQQSTARIAELRLAQVAITKQLELGEKALAATTVSASATVQAAHARRAQAATAAAAATEAANKATIASERAAAAASKTAMAGRGLLAIFGGPTGLAITAGLAATAFFTFADAGNDVRAAINDLQQPLDSLLEKYRRLTQDQRSVAMLKWLEAEQEAAKEANRAYADLTKTLFSYRGAFEELTPERFQLIDQLRKAKEEGAALTPILQAAGKAAGVPESEINKWIRLAGTYADAKAQADQAAKSIKAVTDAAKEPLGLDKLLSGDLFGFNTLPIAENKELEKALLGVYNAQMLNAKAVDAYGVALTGIDLELFKAQFEAAETLPDNAADAIRRFVAEAKTAQANLDISNYLKQLETELGLLDIKLAKGQAEFELQKALAQFTGADPARLKQLEDELKLLQQKQALASDKDTLASLQKENDLLKIRLAQGEAEYEIQKALAQLKGQDPAVIAAIEAELRARQELTKQISISEEIASGAFNQALDDMSALSSAGASFGDAMTQAFGRVAQQIDGMTAAQVNYNQQLDELAKKKEKALALAEDDPKRAKALLDIERTDARLKREHFQAQLGQFSALTGAAKTMFGEQSREREALHRMEMAFSAVEMAMALQRAAANALTAITNQGNGDPYTAFGRIAAMMAIMAGLGVFSGGSSVSAPSAAERQASQGTGTVLGDTDAKSESIVNALDRIAELSLDQYSELRAINQSIRELNQGIAQLAVNLVRSFGRFDSASYQGALGTDKQFQLGSGLSSFVAGGVIGLGLDKLLDGMIGGIFNSILGGISKTTRNLLDSGLSFEAAKIGEILATGLLEGSYYNVIETTKRKLWGLSKKTSTSTEFSELDRAIEAEFGRVFGFLATSITGAVDMLGLDLNKSLNDFVINLPNISFKDLSGDEIQKELEAIFSQQADLMVQYLVPSMAEYQKMGEGLYDTLIRVAQEQAIFNAQLDALGLQLSRFGDIAAETQIAVAQSIIELMGGIEQFRDLTGQYFSAFYTESEQFEFLSRSLSQAFSDLGLALPDARDSFRDIIDSIDITTDAGQALFAQLMQLVPGLDEYYKALKRQEDAAEKAAETERKLAEQRAAFASGFERELTRLDMSALERSLDDLRTWYAEQIEIAQELGAETEFLERLYARKRADAIAAELDKINTTTANELQRLTSEHERAVSALTTQYQQLVGSITNVSNGIGSAILDIQRQMSGWDETGYQNSIVDSLRGQLGQGDIATQVRTIEQLQQAISARYNTEFAAISELANQQQSIISELKSSYEQLQTSIASASAGISSAIDAIRGNSDNAGLIANLYSQLGSGTAAEQIGIITQLQNAISARYSAESSAVNALAQQQQNVINELKTSYDQLLSSIQSASAGISNAMLDIQRQMSGWDELAYQTGQIAELRSQLGSGSAAEQIGIITQLQQAISARYGAESSAINELAQQQQNVINELKTGYDQLLSSIQSASAGISSAMLDIQRQMSGWDELAYQTSQIAELRSQLGSGSAAEQIGIITQLQNAISARYSAESSAVSALAQQQQNVINELKTGYDQLLSSIQSASAGISSAMLDIQRQMSGWDELAYQTGQIAELRSQLGSGRAAEQIGIITQLQNAIGGRYTAELNANRQLQDAANKRYNDELAAVRAMQNAVLQLQQAADAMLLSAASPELLGTQLDEAKRQFDSLLAAANGGDADAARQLQQVGSSYLSIAKDYYAQGSDEYAAIFGQIQSAYRGIGAPAEPAVPAAVLNYQRIDAQIQQAALDELQQLQQLLDTLAEQAAVDNAAQVAAAEAQLAAYQSQTVALQQSAINELQSLQQLLDELAEQAAADNEAQLAEAEAKLAAYQSQTVALQQSAINELQSLQQLLDTLAEQAAADNAAQVASAEAQLAAYQSQNVALQQSAISELQSLQQLLDAIAMQATAENAAQVTAAEAQAAIYQTQLTELQQSAINELSDLQLLLAALEQQAAADLAQQTEALLAEFNAQTEALLQSQAEQIAAVHNAADTIVAAIKELPAPVVEVVMPPPPPVVNVPPVTVDLATPVFNPNDRVEQGPRNDELITQLRDQHNDTTQQNERLVTEMARMRTELRRTQDLTLAAQRIA